METKEAIMVSNSLELIQLTGSYSFLRVISSQNLNFKYLCWHSVCVFVWKTVAKELKESTRKLCRQLQKKPDVEGN